MLHAKIRVAQNALSGLLSIMLLITVVRAGEADRKLTTTQPLDQQHAEARAIQPLSERFAIDEPSTTATAAPSVDAPSFQRHVAPLLGRLGCNGRVCHGSFQGQGGFQLSLFGYDFASDHKALLDADAGRVDVGDSQQSLILSLPTDADSHGGGQRFEEGGWEYWVLRSWIEAGAEFPAGQAQKLQRLEVFPHELQFEAEGETAQLQVFAVWEDGNLEDVTCLTRFHSGDDAIAAIDEHGLVRVGEAGDTHVVASYDNAVVPIPVLRPVASRSPSEDASIEPQTPIDRLIAQKLNKLGIRPSEICTDEEFLRRITLDLTGSLPTTAEVVAFLDDSRDDKRERKIDELLERPSYAARWTTFLCDITGNNDDELRNFLPQGVSVDRQWYAWIYQRVMDNLPYDELVEGIVLAESRLPGESYQEYCEAMSEICRDRDGENFAERPGLVHYWARNNFRTEEERAIGFAYSFLGVRIQCAQCHKHPFDQWSKADFEGFERLFGGVQARAASLAPASRREFARMLDELNIDSSLKGNQLRRELSELLRKGETVPFPELVVASPRRSGNGKAAREAAENAKPEAKLLGGEWVAMDAVDSRKPLMEWLRSEDNPYFARAWVNRVWNEYFGIGIVNPPDDLNLANAPSNAPLLQYLEDGFRESRFDMKWLHREITRSDAYQRSWQVNETNKLDKRNFSHAVLRRLPAETTYDALRTALANDALAARIGTLDTPRASLQAGSSAKSLANNNSTSYALSVFGRSTRESNCDCDRSNDPSLLQTVFLLNDPDVLHWLSASQESWLGQVARKYGWSMPHGSSTKPGREKRLQQMLAAFNQQIERVDERISSAKQRGMTMQVQLMEQRKAEAMAKAYANAERNGLAERFVEETGFDEVAGLDSVNLPRPASRITESRITETQAEWIVEQAYLRTLSRRPKQMEIQVAHEFLLAEDSPVQAVEGLLWSLINTKEFILNH